MTAPLRIAIVGDGIAGIAAAIHLRRLGHAIDHFEGRPAVHAAGAGMLLQPPALALLRNLGIGADDLPLAVRIRGFGAENLKGRRLTRIRYEDHAPGSQALGIQRRYLVDRLHALDPASRDVRFGTAVASVQARRGTLVLKDGTGYGPYDLVVAADGANSALRDGHPHLVRRSHLYASAALVACIDDPDGLAGDELIQYFDGARHVAAWAVGAASVAQPPRVNLSVNVPLRQADSMVGSGEWKRVLARHCPHLRPLVDRLDNDAKPIVYAYRDVSLHRLAEDRLVFIGDAAHSMSPLLGQGARMALLDAQVLAESLRAHGDVPGALAAFDVATRATTAAFQRISRWLTPVFQSENRLLAGVRQGVQFAHRLPVVAKGVRELLIGDGH